MKKDRVAKEYNEIAIGHQQSSKRDLRVMTLDYTLEKTARCLVTGVNVLDLACGNGYFTSLFLNWGANRVIGIDISEGQIELARKSLLQNLSQRVVYHVADVRKNLGVNGKFDLITALMMLHYCSSKNQLLKIFSNVYNGLSKKGVFILAIPNPEIMRDGYNNYGVIIEPLKNKAGETGEGSIIKTTLCDFNGNKFCQFTNYFWRIETYLELMRESGFEDTQIIHSSVSPAGIEKYGEDFWKKFREKPIYVLMSARKN